MAVGSEFADSRGAGPPRVLVIGPRRGLIRALDQGKVRYGVWTDKSKSLPNAEFVHLAPVSVGARPARREAEVLRARGRFSHVIAGGEAAVLAASVARRVLGARKSLHSTVIRCRDKFRMKEHLYERDIPMTAFLPGHASLDAKEVEGRLGLPIVAKLRSQSGGRGIEIIRSAAALPAVLQRRYLLERFVDAPELSVESFVNRGEIQFTSTTEYVRKTFVNVVPAAIDDETRAALLEINRRVIRALKIQWGMTHAEFYVTPTGLLFGEIALRPPGGYIMELLPLAWGFDAWAAFVAMELDQPFDFPVEQSGHAAAVVLHPGAGRVKRIRGRAAIRRQEASIEVKLGVRAGDRIDARVGVGNDVGHVLLRAPTRDALLDAVTLVDDTLQIELETS
jgi:hypothetical protein